MKHTFKLLLGLLILTNFAYGQKVDTLKVYVMIPYKVEVSNDFLNEYAKLKSDILEKRTAIKKQKLADKQENLEEYNKQPEYTRRMFENELYFYDSLTIDNYVSLIVRDYIAYRLYKPFKIKPRLVFLETSKLGSDTADYQNFSQADKNTFIINFPSLKIFRENNEIRVQTKIELFSNTTKTILLTKETIGQPKTEMTDYPMCSGNSWDCAFVNSVYPNLYDVLNLIVENNSMKK
ncbi:MAG: hypothetical protein RSE50_12440 [Myroides sp.]